MTASVETTNLLGLPVGFLMMTLFVGVLTVVLLWFDRRQLVPQGLVPVLSLGALLMLAATLAPLPQRIDQLEASLARNQREMTALQLAQTRQLFAQRHADLSLAAAGRDGALLCVEASGVDLSDNGCDKLIFQRPGGIQTVLEHVSLRIRLLRDAIEAQQRDPQLGSLVNRVRRGLEQDRYGIVARVLEEQSGCKPEACPDLALFGNSSRIMTNLREKTFDALYARLGSGVPLSAGKPSDAPAGSGRSGNALPADYPLPGPESIPAISIMSNEPPPAPPKPTKETPKVAPKARPPARSIPAPLFIQPDRPADESQ